MGRIYQTSEREKKDYLKTRWYKANYQMAKKRVLEVLNDLNLKYNACDDIHGEIFVENVNFDLTITIFEFNGAETSIDITYENKKIFDFGSSKKFIISFYDLINKSLSFKGLSLHP